MTSEAAASINAWMRLRLGARELEDSEIATLATSVETGFGPVRYALGVGGEARLLLPLGSREQFSKTFEASALSVKDSTFVLGRKPQRFIDLTCRERRLEILFAEVTNEILHRIGSGHNSASACNSTIEDYQALLTTSGKSPSTETILGLVGELAFLDRLLDRSSGAWRAWRGPMGDRHDFRSRTEAVEIKTSQRRGANRVRISSLDQLLPPSEGNLYLAHFKLEPSAGASFSVASLFDRCVQKSSSRSAISELLAAVGCRDPNDLEWNELQFNLEDYKIYEVKEGFPRITSASFVSGVSPPGVISLEYIIDLAQAVQFAVTSDAEAILLRRMSECSQIS